MNRTEENEQIAKLEAEIATKTAELKRIKAGLRFDYSLYNSFGDGIYGNISLDDAISPELSKLAKRILVLEEETRTHDGSKFLKAHRMAKEKEMTKEDFSFCNAFLQELYPVIEKYAKIALEKKKTHPESELSE